MRFISVVVLAIFACVGMAAAENEWRRLQFSDGVSVEAPRNWIVGSESGRITVDAYLQAVMSGIERNRASRSITLYHGGSIVAQASFRFYREPKSTGITQAEIAAASPTDVQAGDLAYKQGAERAGTKILQWKGTTKAKTGQFYALVSEYSAQFPHETFPRQFIRVRIYDGLLSFAFLVNYDVRAALVIRSIVDRMVQSLAKSSA